MSYKNKTNKQFESYNNGERSHMVSGDALNAIGDSHKKFQAAIENGAKLGEYVADTIIKHREEKAARDARSAQTDEENKRDKENLDSESE